ncbi:hypothetical protein [Microvirga yunnanensis]|uniref:hypothetical protein n=1 Tax=Microvirga yunnanensis TaxID=2953740 RepID=UPI0021C63FF6|nr:hypothetical protein [Microvirga sp. HBU65207]
MPKHPHRDQAAEYRRQAQEIRTMVQKLSIDEAREQLLETVERLEKLAEEEEKGSGQQLAAGASTRGIVSGAGPYSRCLNRAISSSGLLSSGNR